MYFSADVGSADLVLVSVYFSSRKRHTMCALVTGVQTCALPIYWLDTYFQNDDPGVATAHAELQRLQPLELSPPLPDISRSLGLLRAFMKIGRASCRERVWQYV